MVAKPTQRWDLIGCVPTLVFKVIIFLTANPIAYLFVRPTSNQSEGIYGNQRLKKTYKTNKGFIKKKVKEKRNWLPHWEQHWSRSTTKWQLISLLNHVWTRELLNYDQNFIGSWWLRNERIVKPWSLWLYFMRFLHL